MNFNTYLIWLSVVLFANQVFSDSDKNFMDDVLLPVGIKILPALAIPPPIGPIVMASLGVIQICSCLLKSKDTSEAKVEDPLSKIDLWEARSAIMNEVKALDMHLLQESAKIIRELTMAIESTAFSDNMRECTDSIQRTYADMMKVVIDPKETGMQKRHILQEMLNYSSDFRSKLRSFINKYIKTNVNEISLLKPFKLFYELILEKENMLAESEDDCGSDSLHNKLFKAFMYILKVLTEGYAMVVAAHVVTYQEQLKSDTSASDASEYKTIAVSLVNDYKNDAKILIETTRWALANASREIRNCGTFKLEEGKTIERISVSHMLPKILYFEYIDAFYYKCKSEEKFININDYEIGECRSYTDDIPFGSQIALAIDLKKPNADRTPYSYMKFIKPDNSEALFGRNHSDFAILLNFKNHPECYTTFCTAFKKNLYAISTQRVSAEPGNVITGLRFRVRKSVVYIDIQQGKFINILSVDPNTVYWTETPETDKIEYLGSNLHSIELGDLTPPFMNNTDSMRNTNTDLEINELQLVNADDPTMAPVNSKNLISKPPVAGKRYFVSFQPSDFKNDFGQTTNPSLDRREVFTYPPAPLNGMGLQHVAVKGYGGLISIKLITPNLTDFFDNLKEI